MKRDDCTHLLVEKPEGQKYLFARKWQLCTVHPTVSIRVGIGQYSSSCRYSQYLTDNDVHAYVCWTNIELLYNMLLRYWMLPCCNIAIVCLGVLQ